jgi:hypothetical protein
MAQPIPIPTARKRKKDHRIYFSLSLGWRLPKYPNATEMTAAKNKKA